MGFNTTILFLNDAEYQLESDKDFPLRLAAAIRKAASSRREVDVTVGNHLGGCTVIESHHADWFEAAGATATTRSRSCGSWPNGTGSIW